MAALASTTSTNPAYAPPTARAPSTSGSAVVIAPRRVDGPIRNAMIYLTEQERAICSRVCKVWNMAVLNPSAIPAVLSHLDNEILPQLFAHLHANPKLLEGADRSMVRDLAILQRRAEMFPPRPVVKVNSEPRDPVVQEFLAMSGASGLNYGATAAFPPSSAGSEQRDPAAQAFLATGRENSSP